MSARKTPKTRSFDSYHRKGREAVGHLYRPKLKLVLGAPPGGGDDRE